jgi:hypothetical protein
MTDRFGWSIDISSRPGQGTVVTVQFPDAEFEYEPGAQRDPVSDTQNAVSG